MQNEKEITVNPIICPLCGKKNACANSSSTNKSLNCWCNNPTIKFPKELLKKIPAEIKRQACICQACAEKHQQNLSEKSL